MRNFVRLSVLSLFLLTGCAELNFYSDEDLEPLSVQAYKQASSKYPEVTKGRDYDMVQEVARRREGLGEEAEQVGQPPQRSPQGHIVALTGTNAATHTIGSF